MKFPEDGLATASSLQVEESLETGTSTYGVASTRQERACGVKKRERKGSLGICRIAEYLLYHTECGQRRELPVFFSRR